VDETQTFCKYCGKPLSADAACVDCTLTDLTVSEALSDSAKLTDLEPAPAHLLESHTLNRFPVKVQKVKIGRDPTNQVVIADDPYTSRFHAWITVEDGHYFVEDLGSTNGTLLNGSPLTRRRPLLHGDRVRIGRSDFTFFVEGAHSAGDRKSTQVGSES